MIKIEYTTDSDHFTYCDPKDRYIFSAVSRYIPRKENQITENLYHYKNKVCLYGTCENSSVFLIKDIILMINLFHYNIQNKKACNTSDYDAKYTVNLFIFEGFKNT